MPDPVVGERRTFDGRVGEWDGKGWKPVSETPTRGAARTWTDRAVDALPTLGGFAGGVAGGIGGTVAGMGVGGVPGAVGGAALGGGAGEAAKQLVNRARGAPAPESAMDAVAGIGKEGAVQGASELAGAGAVGLSRVAGRALMEHAVRPTASLLREFPNVMDTILRRRLPVGRNLLPGSEAGSEMAVEQLGDAGRAVRALLTKAEQSGTQFTPDQVAQPVQDLLQELTKQPLGEAEQRQVAGMLQEFLQRHPGPLTPNDVKDLKQAAQAIAKPVYKAADKGFPVSADQSVNARFNSAIASGAKTTLETIPGVAAGESATRDLIGATRAIKAAEGRRLSLGAEAVSAIAPVLAQLLQPDSNLPEKVRNAATAYLVTRGIASPRSLSRVALKLTDTQVQELLRQVPRLAEAVKTQVMATQSPTPTR